MKTPVSLACMLLISLASLGCPLGPFSGSRLSGEVRTEPGLVWEAVESVDNCQLETNPDDPHSSETPGLDPSRDLDGQGGAVGSNLRFVEQIRGGNREYVSVPAESKTDETEEPRGK